MSQITFYYSRICPKCIRVKGILSEIEKEHPDIPIKRVGSLGKVIKRDLYTLPAVEIGDIMLYGMEITKSRILEELKKT